MSTGKKKIKIAINARFLIDGKIEGIGRFSDEVLKRLVKRFPEVEFHFFFDRAWHPRFIYASNVIPHRVYPPARHVFLFIAWFDFMIPFMLKKTGADLFFSPDGYLSKNTNVPQIPVIHDLAFEHFPEDITKLEAWHYQKWFPVFAKKAKHILTVSEFTRKDIIQQYGVAEDKISVVYNGCFSVFKPLKHKEQEETRTLFSGGDPYFLYAGAIQPRKNLENLLKAFEIFKKNTHSPVKLLLTGRKAWNFESVISAYQNLGCKEDIVFTGYVSDETLNALYNASIALCYVSRFEGFGLPILEAMHAETAVITSDTSSLPEVAGAGALYVNPENVEEISTALIKIYEQPEIRKDLIINGILQREKFSWEKTSDACAEVFQNVLKNNGNIDLK